MSSLKKSGVAKLGLGRAGVKPVCVTQAGLQNAALVILLLATCLSSSAFAQTKFTETKKEYRFTVGPHANISVDTQSGAITVKPGNRDEVVVTATIKSDNVEVDQQQNGNRVQIASHMLKGAEQQIGQVNYELLIPLDASLTLHSTNGLLSAEHLQGDLTIEGGDTTVNVRNVENGHVHIQTMRGVITVSDVRNGHIEIGSIGGDIHLISVTGPLVQVSSDRGKIFYDGDFGSGGDYRFTTHSGSIEALVPMDVSADFKAHSVIGRVQHDFPLQARHSRDPETGNSFFGTTGKAASEVVLRSFSGRIRLTQRKTKN
jgi:DUF4097 and DUF4098 domain-containing protein YvlB